MLASENGAGFNCVGIVSNVSGYDDVTHQIVYASRQEFHYDPQLVPFYKAAIVPRDLRGITSLQMGDLFLDFAKICGSRVNGYFTCKCMPAQAYHHPCFLGLKAMTGVSNPTKAHFKRHTNLLDGDDFVGMHVSTTVRTVSDRTATTHGTSQILTLYTPFQSFPSQVDPSDHTATTDPPRDPLPSSAFPESHRPYKARPRHPSRPNHSFRLLARGSDLDPVGPAYWLIQVREWVTRQSASQPESSWTKYRSVRKLLYVHGRRRVERSVHGGSLSGQEAEGGIEVSSGWGNAARYGMSYVLQLGRMNLPDCSVQYGSPDRVNGLIPQSVFLGSWVLRRGVAL